MENGKLPSAENAPAEATESESESEHDEYIFLILGAQKGLAFRSNQKEYKKRLRKQKQNRWIQKMLKL